MSIRKIFVVDEIDEKSQEYIRKAGGRIEIAWTHVPTDPTEEDYKKAMHATLVMLPEKFEACEGQYKGQKTISFMLPNSQVEIYLTYGIDDRLEHTLEYSDQQDWS